MEAKKVVLGVAAIAAAFGIGYYIMKEPEEEQEAAAREISVGARSLGIYCIDCWEPGAHEDNRSEKSGMVCLYQ